MSENVRIDLLDARGVEQAADELADVLLDCIAGGASVSFIADFTHREFACFWQTPSLSKTGTLRCWRHAMPPRDFLETGKDGVRFALYPEQRAAHRQE